GGRQERGRRSQARPPPAATGGARPAAEASDGAGRASCPPRLAESPATREGLNEPRPDPLVGTFRPTPPGCAVCSKRRTRPRAEGRGRSVAAGLPGMIRRGIIATDPARPGRRPPTSAGQRPSPPPALPEPCPMAAIAADRDLLFGLLALQNGLINQVQ